LAAAAACMPAQADWLNDLSLMPPVSVTMQPRNELAAAGLLAAADVDAGADEAAADVVVVAAGALDELLPHAAITRLAATAAAAAINAECFTVSSTK
jgi:hypothetical protein